jgi:hypothetical protein
MVNGEVKKMFFVYHGYCSPDNYDSSEGPTYKITECTTLADLSALKRNFDENVSDECTNVIFRVFEGVEWRMKPVETVAYFAEENNEKSESSCSSLAD